MGTPGAGVVPSSQTVELMTLETEDGLTIDAVLHAPEGAQTIVVHVHGKGGNFYSGPGRFIPELTADDPLAHLSINMHCHDLAYTRYDREWFDLDASERVAGGFWEDLSRGHLDLAAAVAECRRRGFPRIVLAGHSSGGFYAGMYAARDHDLAGLALLSPLTANASAFSRWFGDDAAGHAAALAAARGLVADGHGHWIVPLASWYFGISARALLQRDAEPAGIWPAAVAAFPGPLLTLWSAEEDRDGLWAQLHEQLPQTDKTALRLASGDHQYHCREAEVAAAVSRFALRR